jgi:hypothetical protein
MWDMGCLGFAKPQLGGTCQVLQRTVNEVIPMGLASQIEAPCHE